MLCHKVLLYDIHSVNDNLLTDVEMCVGVFACRDV